MSLATIFLVQWFAVSSAQRVANIPSRRCRVNRACRLSMRGVVTGSLGWSWLADCSRHHGIPYPPAPITHTAAGGKIHVLGKEA